MKRIINTLWIAMILPFISISCSSIEVDNVNKTSKFKVKGVQLKTDNRIYAKGSEIEFVVNPLGNIVHNFKAKFIYSGKVYEDNFMSTHKFICDGGSNVKFQLIDEDGLISYEKDTVLAVFNSLKIDQIFNELNVTSSLESRFIGLNPERMDFGISDYKKMRELNFKTFDGLLATKTFLFSKNNKLDSIVVYHGKPSNIDNFIHLGHVLEDINKEYPGNVIDSKSGYFQLMNYNGYAFWSRKLVSGEILTTIKKDV